MSWRIVDVSPNDPIGGLAADIARMAGASDAQQIKVYTIEFEDTGETRKVIAMDEYELGSKISRGDFYD